MMEDDNDEDVLVHEGVLHKSGRYPWGSGENPHQRNRMFLDTVESLSRKGMSDTDIAKSFELSTTQLRALKAVAKNEQKAADISRAKRLKDAGNSNVAIGEKMGLNESSVRALLDPTTKAKNDELVTTANMLKDQIASKRYIDIGSGVENQLGIAPTKLSTAAAMLEEEGYKRYKIKNPQQTTGHDTTYKVLGAPDTTFKELVNNKHLIQNIDGFSEDNGRTFEPIRPPVSVDSKRVAVRWAEEGGTDRDGVIELRRGVDDISLGNKRYAQVRIAVDGSHYLKGMAMYNDNLPDGVDMVFNTNKSKAEKGGDKLAAMKPMKEEEGGEFGSTVRQKYYVDKDGNRKQSALNIVGSKDGTGEEGGWYQWSKNLSSQFLSKQSNQLAKEQLDLTYQIKKDQFDEIMALTNPAVKKKLLKTFSDETDSSAVKLQAAGLPRTRSHVILPVPELKDTEIYAPQYKNGERVALVRHPHGGKFEIPELIVNNRNTVAKRLLGQAEDAVGINPKVAQRLSGADFDGDTVLVIPNNHGKVKSSAPLQGLKDFDPQASYPKYEGMKVMTPKGKQKAMGDVSNLITDMTLKGAKNDELARAVKHSMVVIDAEKHKLNYKQSAKDNRIAELKEKYQGGPRKGASTVISQASSEITVDARKARSAKDGGPIDRTTGKLVYTPTGESYTKVTTYKRTGVVKEEVKKSTIKSKKMLETDDAHTLSSGTKMEAVYADHANRLKALANESRKALVSTPSVTYSPSANKTYAKEVGTLTAKLNIAKKNAPLERQAQLVAAANVKAKREARPDMEADELKKLKGRELDAARKRLGAKKKPVVITPIEWEAIQAGAITNNKLDDILLNTDIDQVKKLAMPRDRPSMSAGKTNRAKAMLKSGYTQAEIAEALGVPTTTLHDALNTGEEG